MASARYFTAKQNVGRVKSSVDDLIMERGTVSMRVAFVLRSAEVQPLFWDLCESVDIILLFTAYNNIYYYVYIYIYIIYSLASLSPPLYVHTYVRTYVLCIVTVNWIELIWPHHFLLEVDVPNITCTQHNNDMTCTTKRKTVRQQCNTCPHIHYTHCHN